MSKGKTNIRSVGGKTLGNATVLDYAYDIPNDVIYVSSGPRPSFSPLDQREGLDERGLLTVFRGLPLGSGPRSDGRVLVLPLLL